MEAVKNGEEGLPFFTASSSRVIFEFDFKYMRWGGRETKTLDFIWAFLV